MNAAGLIAAAFFCALVALAKLKGLEPQWILAAGLWIVGVGHGMFDAAIAGIVFRTSLKKATAVYVTVALAAGTLAWFAPLTALILQTATSAFHFGSSEWRGFSGHARSERLAIFVWGSALVLLMILGPWSDSERLLDIFLQGEGRALLRFCASSRVTILALSFFSSAVSAAYLARSDRGELASRLLDLLLLNALFLTLPLWLSFSLFLPLWHGLRSLSEDTFPLLNRAAKKPNFQRALRPAFFFAALTTAALVGGAFVFHEHAPHLPWLLGPLGFVLLTAITIPHVLVMDQVAKSGLVTVKRWR